MTLRKEKTLKTLKKKNRLMYIYIIKATLLSLCHSDMFQSSKSHLQGERQTHFNSLVKQYELPDVKFWKSNNTYSSKVTKNIKMYNIQIIKSL